MRRLHATWTAAAALFVAASLALVFDNWARAQEGPAEAPIASAQEVGKAFAKVARKSMPAVVYLHVERDLETPAPGRGLRYNDPFDLFDDEIFERFFRDRMPRPPEGGRGPFVQRGQGSGFLISPDGLVLTNHHVVGDADRVHVHLHDGRKFDGTLVGTDAKSDVALLRIDAEGLPHLPLGDSDAIEVGQWAIAIGNPFGLTETVTSGIVSAKGRTRVGIAEYEDFIQTDAAINPGNSGGPLLNLKGEAIGINTAIFSRSGGYMGIGFAIPINLAKSIKDQLLQHGRVERGFLGVVVQDVTPELADSFGLDKNEGALIADVADDTPASRAGLQPGDVILEIDGTPVTGSGRLRNAVARLLPGTKTELLVSRDGETRTIAVTLGEQEAAAHAPAESKQATTLGLEVGPLTRERSARLGYRLGSGVIVTRVDPGSVAAMAGIRPGNLITSVDRKPVKTVDDFHEALSEAGDSVLMRTRDGRAIRWVVLKRP